MRATLLCALLALAGGCASLEVPLPLGPSPPSVAPPPPVAEAWRRDVEGAFGPAAPLVAGRALFVGTRRGDVVALDRASGRLLGRTRVGDSVEGALALSENAQTVFAASAAGGPAVSAIDLRDGRERWRWPARSAPREERRRAAVLGGVVRAGDVVVATTARGVTVGLDAATGAERWRHTTRDTLALVRTPPVALPGGAVLVSDAPAAVVALDPASGAERWRADAPGPLYAAPTVTGGLVVLTTTRGAVVALDAATGAARWRADVPEVRLSAVAIGDGRIVAGGSDGAVRAWDAATGRALWTWQGPDAVAATPLVGGGVVWAGTLGRRLVALDAATGAERFSTELPGRVRGALAAADGTLFVLAEPRHVHAFRPAAR